MTFETIEEQFLPNGLHDSRIEEIKMDYGQACLTISITALVGLPEDPPDKEPYRAATMTFQGVKFFSVDFPVAESSFRDRRSLWILSFGRTPPDLIPSSLVNILPTHMQYYSFFIHDWFSYIHIAAEDIGLSWA